MPREQTISKTAFVKCIQCPKSLYLYKNHYNQRDPLDEETRQKFELGHHIGDMAKMLFPGGLDLTPPSHFQFKASINHTQKAIADGIKIMYEPAFQYHQFIGAMDIMCYTENSWQAYEVKSSSKVADVHIQDAAFQYFIITNSGVSLTDISIVTTDQDAILAGKNYREIFKINSIIQEVLSLQPFIKNISNLALDTLAKKEIPNIHMGTHCYEPYKCEFTNFCRRLES
jgi:hypothetical protein